MLQAVALKQPGSQTLMLRAVATPALPPAKPVLMMAGVPARPGVACSSCCLRGVCLPCGLEAGELTSFDEIASAKRRVVRGAPLYHGGDAFEFLYAVKSGAFKTVGVSRDGQEKITGFHLSGELLGLEAINTGRHAYAAIALEDSEVCAISFAALERLASRMPVLQHHLFRVLSSDISRDHGLMLLLGSMSAEQRLAAFLLSLSQRYQRLGFASDRFTLRMTREEIGNYLGLTLETVSRLLSRFQREGLVAVRQRDIVIHAADRLREMVGHW